MERSIILNGVSYGLNDVGSQESRDESRDSMPISECLMPVK